MQKTSRPFLFDLCYFNFRSIWLSESKQNVVYKIQAENTHIITFQLFSIQPKFNQNIRWHRYPQYWHLFNLHPKSDSTITSITHVEYSTRTFPSTDEYRAYCCSHGITEITVKCVSHMRRMSRKGVTNCARLAQFTYCPLTPSPVHNQGSSLILLHFALCRFVYVRQPLGSNQFASLSTKSRVTI